MDLLETERWRRRPRAVIPSLVLGTSPAPASIAGGGWQLTLPEILAEFRTARPLSVAARVTGKPWLKTWSFTTAGK